MHFARRDPRTNRSIKNPVTTSPPPPQVRYDQVVNWHSGKCLDVDGASQANRAKVQQYTCNGTVAQQWTKRYKNSDYFELVLAGSGKCMEVASSSQRDNGKVQQFDCNGGYNQQWRQPQSGVSGYPHLVARHSGKCLTILSESLLDRAQAVQYACGPDGPDTLHAGDWRFQ